MKNEINEHGAPVLDLTGGDPGAVEAWVRALAATSGERLDWYEVIPSWEERETRASDATVRRVMVLVTGHDSESAVEAAVYAIPLPAGCAVYRWHSSYRHVAA
jgi:hypothetical protein